MEILSESTMVVDQNEAFGSPIKLEATQTSPPLEEPKRIDSSKTLTIFGLLTPSEPNPIFAQLFDKEIPIKRSNLSSSKDWVVENLILLANDLREGSFGLEEKY